jgi:hypothetical protein
MTRIIAGALLLIGLTLGAVVRAEACDTTLRWAWNAYEPYSYRDEIGDLVGLDVDLTRAILDLAGCMILSPAASTVSRMSWRYTCGLLPAAAALTAPLMTRPGRGSRRQGS